ncbi:hypothetical protein ACVWY2_008429 [Bradyrhizobium sp. JR6.1]
MTDNLEERSADSGVEEVLDEIIDLEEYAKLGKRPPLSKGYRILVNGDPFVVNEPTPTGRRHPDACRLAARGELYSSRQNGR